jgi:hypothetical protein
MINVNLSCQRGVPMPRKLKAAGEGPRRAIKKICLIVRALTARELHLVWRKS